MEAAFKDEIAKAVSNGFTAEEVATAKNALMQERQLSRSQDGSLAGLFVSQAELGRTMQRESDLEKKYQRYDSRTAFDDLQEMDRSGDDFLLQIGRLQEGGREVDQDVAAR